MFNLPHFAALIAALGLTLVPTWLGYWGHPLVKPSKLLVNMERKDLLLGTSLICTELPPLVVLKMRMSSDQPHIYI